MSIKIIKKSKNMKRVRFSITNISVKYLSNITKKIKYVLY